MFGINSIGEEGESQQSSRYFLVYPGLVSSLKTSGEFRIFGEFRSPIFLRNNQGQCMFIDFQGTPIRTFTSCSIDVSTIDRGMLFDFRYLSIRYRFRAVRVLSEVEA